MTHFYVSEFDQFLNTLKREHPEISEQQRQGRALLWDKSPSTPDGQPPIVGNLFARPCYVCHENRSRQIANIAQRTSRAKRPRRLQQ